MAQNSRQIAGRSRGGPLRIKILADDKSSAAPAAVRRETAPSQSTKLATASSGAATTRVGRAALGDLSNNNRKSEPNPTGVGKEKNPAPRPTSVLNQLPQRIVRRIAQVPSNGVAGNPAKATGTRQRPSSVPNVQATRPAPRAREDDDEEVIGSAKKKMRTGSSRPAAPPAPIIEQELENMEISDVVEKVQPLSEEIQEEKDVEDHVTVAQEDLTIVPNPQAWLYDWTRADPESEARYAQELEVIKKTFQDPVDEWDTTMVSEYSDEIFTYMAKLEVDSMADPDYMTTVQTEIKWDMRAALIDWLLQVHLRYHMLPETLWITVNIIDRFLSKRNVSTNKLQLVGITAMFIASKYEEIMAPSVEEFAYMTEGLFTKEEVLKGERIILQTLEFSISSYCSPYSWVRRISKADDYDIQTRTLSKYLIEVILLDHRFLRAKPSLIAAIGMYTARRMLGGEWDEAFIFYSGFTEAQLEQGHAYLLELLSSSGFEDRYVSRKYASKKFLKASVFAREWAKAAQAQAIAEAESAGEEMVLDRDE